MFNELYKIFDITFSSITEMAFDRKKAVFEITNLCIPYTTHILKLALFGDNSKYEYEKSKWKDEIYNFINQASLYYNLKNSKTLKPKDYTENFFFGLFETVDEVRRTCEKLIKDFKRQGYEIPQEINYEKLFERHRIFVESVLKDFPDIEYDRVLLLLYLYIEGARK